MTSHRSRRTSTLTLASSPRSTVSRALVEGRDLGDAITGAADSAEVLSALRFGWSVAELKGRVRTLGSSAAGGALPTRTGHALPLRIERSPAELVVEVKETAASLAKLLGVGQPDGDGNGGTCT